MIDKMITESSHLLQLCLGKSTYSHKNGFGVKPDSSEIQRIEKSEISHTEVFYFIQKCTTATFTYRK